MVNLKDLLECANTSDVPVIISERDYFDYSRGEPDQNFDTVLRILNVFLGWFFP
jgi:hypothetical protein